MISRRLWRRILLRDPDNLPAHPYLGQPREPSTEPLGDDSPFRYVALVMFGAGVVFLPLVSAPSVLGVLVASVLYLPLSLISLISLVFSWYVLLGHYMGLSAALRVSHRVASLGKTGLMPVLSMTPAGLEGVLMTIVSRALLPRDNGANLPAHKENHTTLIVSLAGVLVFALAVAEFNRGLAVTSSVALGLTLLGMGVFGLLYASFRQEVVLGAVAGLMGGLLLRRALTPRIGGSVVFVGVMILGWVAYGSALYGAGWLVRRLGLLPEAPARLQVTVSLMVVSLGLALVVREVAIVMLWRRIRRWEVD